VRQNRYLVTAAASGCDRAVREQFFPDMQTGLPNRPINFVVKPVRQIDLLRLLHLDQVRAPIVEARVMTGYDGIMSGGLAQLIGRRYAARDYRVRVDQTTAARLNLRSRLRFAKESGVRCGGKRCLPFQLSSMVTIRDQADPAHAHGNKDEKHGDTKN
jgi:hypothetical protein